MGYSVSPALIGPGGLLTYASQQIPVRKVPEAPEAPLDFGPSTSSVYPSFGGNGSRGYRFEFTSLLEVTP